jgi:hypothetical protein
VETLVMISSIAAFDGAQIRILSTLAEISMATMPVIV